MPLDESFMQSPIDESGEGGLLRLFGSVEHVIYQNEENGYSICDFSTDAGELFTIVGTMPDVSEGDLLSISGKWVHNSKYGRQFRVEMCEKKMPVGSAAILRYLSSGAIRGIGPKTARRIVDLYGDETFEVMENHPDWLAEIPGITSKRAREIAEDFRKKADIRAAMLFFRDYFGPTATIRIYKKWGSAAIDVAKRNPYRLCEEIDGIGFERADRMALQIGLQPDSPARLESGICYLLGLNAQQNGHVCLPREVAEESAGALLGVSFEQAHKTVDDLLSTGKLRQVLLSDHPFLYDLKQYESETYIAKKMVLLDQVCPAMETANIGAILRREEAESGISYAAMQRKAMKGALENGVLILTGGPGTGKTTVVRALLRIFQSMGERPVLTAPTGRAAKRLSEATSCEAKTIHRLLEYGGEEGDRPAFRRGEHALLEETVIIVDEVSMVDNALMCALLKAIKPGARLILIGDSDQLPSVGAGNILHDIIESNRFFTVRLSEIFRQAQKSLIVTNAHAINRGEMPDLKTKDNDFFFLPRSDDASIGATVSELCATRLPKTYGEMGAAGVQVIAPSRKGEVGTETLNRQLQDVLNPAGSGKNEYRFRETVFREGDRVMQIRNNYDLEWTLNNGAHGTGVFNGDIGTVLEIRGHDSCMIVRFDEKTVQYDLNMLEDLEPAYAITVHKSQGSEYPIVVLPISDRTPPMLLSRNLLYTAVTRAQTMVILVGSEAAVGRMVANNRQTMRYTGLAQWLRGISL